MNIQERQEFVRSHRVCVFGYNRQANGPAMSLVYYVMDGDDVLVSTMAERGDASPAPYATFETPPRHVAEPDDVKGLTHWLGSTLPWNE
jgi:hypothetical protein